jgi:hypothetical protein
MNGCKRSCIGLDTLEVNLPIEFEFLGALKF